MKIFNRIQSAFANFLFQSELKKLLFFRREVVNFEHAKRIGILYDATNDGDFEIIKQYIKQIRGLQKEVVALGYVDKKQLPQNRFPQYGLDFFTKKDMGWKMIPNSIAVTNFINEAYDIVVNLSNNTVFPLCYIAAVSKAKLRVGRFNHRFIHCYDLMIETTVDTDFKSFIRQTEEYLKKLNK